MCVCRVILSREFRQFLLCLVIDHDSFPGTELRNLLSQAMVWRAMAPGGLDICVDLMIPCQGVSAYML